MFVYCYENKISLYDAWTQKWREVAALMSKKDARSEKAQLIQDLTFLLTKFQ